MKKPPNSKSICRSWEEALAVTNNLRLPPLSIRGYYDADLEDEAFFIGLDHLWDITKVKDVVFDKMLQVVGLVNYFIVEH